MTNSQTDVRDTAEELHEQFSEHIDVSREDIEERLERLVGEYKVPMAEARRSVTNHYLEEAGLSRDDLGGGGGGGNREVQVADVDAPDEWVDLTAKVVELWEPRSDAVGQVGLLGDPTGTIKFTAWATSDLPDLAEGTVYRLENVVTDEYEGRYSVKLNRTTSIEAVDEDLEVGSNDVEVEGALVDIQSGSGLIKRCPEEGCTRVLQNGRCGEHGEVEGEFDLRIKGVLDDGSQVQEVIFDQVATEELTGLSLEDAKEMAQDALDTSVVAEEIGEETLGRYYRVVGPRMGRYVLADEIDPLGGPADPEGVLIKARSVQ